MRPKRRRTFQRRKPGGVEFPTGKGMKMVQIIPSEKAVPRFLKNVESGAACKQAMKGLVVFIKDALDMSFPAWKFMEFVQTHPWARHIAFF